MRPAPLLSLVVLVLALVAIGCGSDDEDPSTAERASGRTELTETETAPDLEDTSVKPVLDKPTGSPPRRLEREDIVKGKGKAAKNGDTVTVQYVGVNFSNGQEFDASWERGEPFTFPLGAGRVIPGWDKGLVGMKVGGRRQLTIPPEMAYGAEGSPPAIGPNETLVFVVDLQSID